MISIGRLDPADRAGWEVLFRAYIDFYERTEPQDMYDRAWNEFQDPDTAFSGRPRAWFR